MNKVSYTNETTRFQHVGGVTIPPGETRDVDPSLLPDYQPEGVAVEEEEIDQVAELLKVNVKLVTEQLPHMSDDQLAHAVLLEQAGQNRKSLIEAMTAENLRRATDKAGA
ncbi:hypothetical protein [Herminiimonas sp. CN]|uniref:hypothetical protein n=1 Tax=Herminiimonas sp. CN TaxID=1349818 RepID=UPI00047435F0|nr:hypothetical protein [Herminiimonas sp. CN]